MYPAPTLAPEPQPIDVIAEYLTEPDDLPKLLWRYCALQYSAGEAAIDPLGYFIGEIIEPEVLESDDDADTISAEKDLIDRLDDPLLDEDDDGDETPDAIEPPEAEDFTLEQKEQMVLYAPYMRALAQFWSAMVIFMEDNPSVPDWQGICEQVNKFVNFIPVDRDRLIRHVHRINNARMEAQSLQPRMQPLAAGTALYDIRFNKFD